MAVCVVIISFFIPMCEYCTGVYVFVTWMPAQDGTHCCPLLFLSDFSQGLFRNNIWKMWVCGCLCSVNGQSREAAYFSFFVMQELVQWQSWKLNQSLKEAGVDECRCVAFLSGVCIRHAHSVHPRSLITVISHILCKRFKLNFTLPCLTSYEPHWLALY